jgi:two-component system, cell cycle response regulator DivK
MSAKILLIEDHEQNRYLVTFLLERHGYSVVSAADGLRGIEMACSLSPDLILLDIQLPGMDGYQVARSIRELDNLRETPVVAVTSYAMVGDRERALAAGCDAYMEKPIDPDTFVAQVEACLARAGSPPPPGDGAP